MRWMTLKIGIFSDVHGHLNELKQTLALLEELAVDKIICTGDLVDKGSDSNGVVKLMKERAIPCIQGNHDLKACYIWLSYQETLEGDTVDYLSQLPTSLSYEWEGVSLYFCHENPWRDPSFYIFPSRPRILHQQVAEAVPEKVIVMGHTHHPMRVEVDGKILINSGSIYGNRDRPERTCGILSLPDCGFEIYDIETKQKLVL
jgi:putative phosphoesterase